MSKLSSQENRTVRLLPFDDNNICKFMYSYGCLGIHDNFHYHSNILRGTYSETRKHIQFTTHYIFVVEFEGKLQPIVFGLQMKRLIESYITDNSLTLDFFRNNYVELDIVVGMTSIYFNYENSTINVRNKIVKEYSEKDYHRVMSYYSNETSTISDNALLYIESLGILNPQYIYLLRNMKINKLRKKQVKMSRDKKWGLFENILNDKLYGDSEKFGLIKNDDDEDTYQIVIGGHLFETKIIENEKIFKLLITTIIILLLTSCGNIKYIQCYGEIDIIINGKKPIFKDTSIMYEYWAEYPANIHIISEDILFIGDTISIPISGGYNLKSK